MASYLGNNIHNLEHPSTNRNTVRDANSSVLQLPNHSVPHGAMMPLGVQMDASFGSDMSLSEAVQHLQGLMRENQELQGTIRENNDMMKTVQHVLVEMKTNWEKEKADAIKKFDQAKNIILTLRKDVEVKRNKIEALEKKCGQSSINSVTKSKQEVDALVKELSECKQTLSQIKKDKESQSKEIENLQIKNQQSQNRLSHENDELKMLRDSLADKSQECESLESKMSQLVQHNKKLAELKSRLTADKDELLLKIRDTQSQLDKLKESSALKKESGEMDSSFLLVEEVHNFPRSHGKSAAGTENSKQEDRLRGIQSEGATQDEALETEQDLSKGDVMSLLKKEQLKVSELTSRISNLSLALETSAYELQIKDESLSHLKCSLDGQMKQLEEQHKKKQEALLLEIDSMQRHMQQSQSFEDPSRLDSIGNMKAQVMSLLHEVQESNRRLEISNVAARRFQKKCEELELKCTQKQEELDSQRSKDDHLIEALRGAISSTESSLAMQKEKNDKKSSVIQENILEIQELKKECSTLKYQLEEQRKKAKNGASDGKVMLTAAQKRELDEKIDNLTAQLISNEDTLMVKQSEIHKLQEKIILLRNENEDLPLLKDQMTAYKSDFEKQLKLCEKLHREKMAMMEEVDTFRLANSQLREQLNLFSTSHYYSKSSNSHYGGGTMGRGVSERDRMRSRPYPSGGYDECDTTEAQGNNTGMSDDSRQRKPTEHSSGPSSFEASSAIADEAMKKTYECPKCGLGTQDIDSLTIHVDECLQE